MDVDLVVVTTFDPASHSPERVVARLTPFLERHFQGRWSQNDRSVKIAYEDTPVTLDLVVTAAPSMVVQEALLKAAEGGRLPGRLSLADRPAGELGDIMSMREVVVRIQKAAEGEEWREDFLLIPDRRLQRWVKTHPIEQIAWTEAKNARTHGHYVNVVKAVKWWRRRHNIPEHPKGHPA